MCICSVYPRCDREASRNDGTDLDMLRESAEITMDEIEYEVDCKDESSEHEPSPDEDQDSRK